MYLKLALKNLLNQKMRTLITTLGITIGICSLTLMLALSAALKQTIFQNLNSRSPLTQITIQTGNNNNNFFKIISAKKQGSQLTPAILDQLRKLPNITAVYPEINYNNISSLQIDIFGQTFQTDSMIFGMPYEYIKDDLIDENAKTIWQNADSNQNVQEPYPAIIPRKIIDLYNLTVAPSNSLPKFSEKNLLGTELTLIPDQSTFFGQNNSSAKRIKVKIVGFSDRVSLIGATLPLEIIKNLNLQRDPNYQENYLRVFAEVDQPENVDKVLDQIKILGFDGTTAIKELQTIQSNLQIVTIGLSLISLIILLVAGLTIANTFLASVNERKKEIGIFRALGATRTQIQKMFLAEAAMIGLIGGISGILIALIGSAYLNQYALSTLPDFTSKPASLFIFDPLTLFLTLLFSIILSTIFALLPATKAAHLKPVDALMN